MNFSLPLIGGIVGGLLALVFTLYNNKKYKAILNEKRITMKKFKGLSKSSYEVYYIGPKRDCALFKIDGIKHLDYKELILLRNKESAEELPFDSNKHLIICLLAPNFVTQLNIVAKKFNLEYSYLGERRELIYKKRKK